MKPNPKKKPESSSGSKFKLLKQLKYKSKLVRKESLEILKEFESLYDLNNPD